MKIHDIDLEWLEGVRYELSNARCKSWNDGQRGALYSATQFSASGIGDGVTLLAIGDTRFGRENDKEPADDPNRDAKSFLKVSTQTKHFDGEVVIHAGSVFGDQVAPEVLAIGRTGLEILERNNIQFHFIPGNHETSREIELFEEHETTVVTQLDTDGVRVGNCVEVVGVDHRSPDEFSISARDFGRFPDVSNRMLVLHQDLTPANEEGERRPAVSGGRTYSRVRLPRFRPSTRLGVLQLERG